MALEDDNAFTDAFAELSKLGTESTNLEATDALEKAGGDPTKVEPVVEPVVDPAAKVEPVVDPAAKVEPVVDPAAKVEPVVDPAAKVEPVVDPAAKVEPVVDPAAKVEPPAKVESPKADEGVLERLAAILEDKKPTVEAPAPKPAPELYTADEKAFLESYEKEWPDVARAESLRRRGEYNQIVDYIFGEVVKELGPLKDNVAALAQRSHVADLHNLVEDYDTIRDKVVEWANSQPAYLQPSYQHVIEQGTADEVKDLIGRWRQSTGVGVETTKTAPTPKADTELPKDAKQAASSLAPVSSKRTQVPAASEPEDFDGAFAAAAAATEKV